MANATAGNSDDYVIATGRMESVRKFIEISAKELGWNKTKNSQEYFGKVKELMKLDLEQIIIKWW